MSTENGKVDLGGYNLKEWSLIILWIGLAFTFGAFGIGFAVAIANNPQISISGEIDLGQFTGVVIGIAMVAVVLVGQKLTAQSIAATTKQADDAWIESEKK